MVEKYTDFVLRWRGTVILLTLLLTALTGFGFTQLKFETDYRIFFSEENPQLNAFDALQKVYGKRDNLMIGLAFANGDVFTRDNLALIETLTERAWQTPYSRRVDSIANFQHTYAKGDDLIVESLVEDAGSMSDAEIARVRRIALNDSFLVDRLVSRQGHVAAVNITMNLPSDAGPEQLETVAWVRENLKEWAEAQQPSLETQLIGETMMMQSFFEAMVHDATALFPLMYAVILVLMAVLLRSAWSILVTTVVIILSTLVSVSVAGLLGIPMGPMAGIVPLVVLTLAVADSIHILVTLFQQMGAGLTKREAIVESMRVNMQPVFLTSLTTVIGFLSLNFNESPPFRFMGNMVAIGITGAFIYSVTILPALLSYMPLRPGTASGGETRLMDRFASLAVRERNAIGVGFLIFLVFMGFSLTLNRYNDTFTRYFDSEMTFRQDLEFLSKNLTGIMQVHHSIDAGEDGDAFEPDYLAQLDELAQWYDHQPGILHVESFTQIIKRINRTLHQENPLYYTTPRDREEAAQYTLLYEFSLPYGLDMNNILNLSRSATRLTVTFGNVDSADIVDTEARAHEFAEQQLPAVSVGEGVGPSVMMGHLGRRNSEAMIPGMVLAVVLISMTVLAALRSTKLGMLSFFTILLPSIVTFGLWGMIDGNIGVMAASVVAIALGIVVDNNVHFFSKYQRARREQSLATREAMHYAFRTVGVAIGVNSLILAVGFALLAESWIKPNQDMGILTAIAIVYSLLQTYLLLPTLLLIFDREPSHAS